MLSSAGASTSCSAPPLPSPCHSLHSSSVGSSRSSRRSSRRSHSSSGLHPCRRAGPKQASVKAAAAAGSGGGGSSGSGGRSSLLFPAAAQQTVQLPSLMVQVRARACVRACARKPPNLAHPPHCTACWNTCAWHLCLCQSRAASVLACMQAHARTLTRMHKRTHAPTHPPTHTRTRTHTHSRPHHYSYACETMHVHTHTATRTRRAPATAESGLPSPPLPQVSAADVMAPSPDLSDVVSRLVGAGATAIILGEGNSSSSSSSNSSGNALYQAAVRLKQVLRGRVPLLLLDRTDIVQAAEADGVLLTDQGELPAAACAQCALVHIEPERRANVESGEGCGWHAKGAQQTRHTPPHPHAPATSACRIAPPRRAGGGGQAHAVRHGGRPGGAHRLQRLRGRGGSRGWRQPGARDGEGGGARGVRE